ncbi:MAG TPA: DNA gyrase inhibitor YacG [Terriglobales bacterium]
MPRKRKISVKCPTCKQAVKSTSEDFPFCSERCRVIDLGKWASGQYVVSSPLRDTSDASGLPKLPGSNDEE